MRRLLEKLGSSEEQEFEADSYLDLTDSTKEETRWLNENELYEIADSIPEPVVDYGMERFVQNGELSLGHFAEALKEADQVWQKYRERDEHNPRKISKREAFGYGAGAEPGIITNAPRYSKEVEKEVNSYSTEIVGDLGSFYSTAKANHVARTLMGPEEPAQAELILREETNIYED